MIEAGLAAADMSMAAPSPGRMPGLGHSSFRWAAALAIGVHAGIAFVWSLRIVPELPGGAAPAVAVRILAAPESDRRASLPIARPPVTVEAAPMLPKAPTEPEPAAPRDDSAVRPTAATALQTDAAAVADRRSRRDASAAAVSSGAKAADAVNTASVTPLPASAPLVPTPAAAAPVPLALSEEPAYHRAATLDPGPRPLSEVEPVYPPEAKLQEGTVVLRLLISATGNADRVDVVRARPPGLFEAAAVEAFTKARYEPGRLAGIPVQSQITIEVHFAPINRGARVTGKTY